MRPKIKLNRLTSLLLLLTTVAIFSLPLKAQDLDYSGKYRYAVVDTPYGDFFGWLVLKKEGKNYEAQIANDEGIEFDAEVIRQKGNKLIIRSNIEETNSVLSCELFGDSLRADVTVQGEDFPFLLKAKKSL